MTFPLTYNGWVILDKPLHMTSSTAVQKIRHLLGRIKAGHGGTLDPLATGILPIALGEATKLIPFIMDKEKTYEFTVTWGTQTTTDDIEGDIIATAEKRPSAAEISTVLSHFIGDIYQKPPAYSALKIQGRRACDRVRQGEEVDLPVRPVFIKSLELIEVLSMEQASFKVVCGKGTYVRSLGRDLAHALGTVGHISLLRRTAVGPFSLEKAITFEKVLELKGCSALQEIIHPLSIVLDDIPVIVLNEANLWRLKHGQQIKLVQNNFTNQRVIACQDENHTLYAIAKIEDSILMPIRVFNL